VRVAAVGLNFADLFAAQGLYSATPRGSFIPGLECAGHVEALGPDTAASGNVAVGDRVMVLTRFGAYATALNIDARYVFSLPAGWSAAEGAGYLVQTLTAWYGLATLGAIERGDVVLVQSAAGGVGLQALALCAELGARPIATVGSDAKREFLVRERGLAPASVIVRDRRRFGEQLSAALGALGATGIDVVLDAVLGSFFRPAFQRLAPEGRFVLFGAADFMSRGSRPNYLKLAWEYLTRPRLAPLAMISDNRSLMAFNLIWLWDQVDRVPATLAAMEAVAQPRPYIGARLPFDKAPEALRLLQAGGTIGKVVLEL
jgi:alcohol dehydrogenase